MTNEDEVNKERFVRRELNFDFGQLFYPQEKRRIFDIRCFTSEIKTQNNEKKIVKATLYPNHELGTLNTLDERVFYALIELWEEQGRPNKVIFSLREIARKLHTKWGKDTPITIDASLTRLRTAYIIWEGSFYNKVNEEYISIKNPFTIINHLKVISTKERGIGSQIAEFSFDEHTLSNLSSNYSRPIRFDVIITFKSPLSQSLYTQLDRKLYGTKEYSRTTAGIFFKDLYLIAERYKGKHIRIQTLKSIRNELVGKGLSYGEIIEDIKINTKAKGDAIFIATRSGAGKVKGEKINLSQTTNTPDANTKSSLTEKPHPKKIKPQPNHQSVEISPATEELLNYFDQKFSLVSIKTGKVISKADELIKEHGLTKCKFLVEVAKVEVEKTNYSPNSFNGITRYLPQALESYVNYEKTLELKRQQEERAERERQKARRVKYQEQNLPEYEKYLLELISSVEKSKPNIFKKFVALEASEMLAIEEQFSGDNKQYLREMGIRRYRNDVNRINRFIEFFANEPAVTIPNFWEWDATRKGLGETA